MKTKPLMLLLVVLAALAGAWGLQRERQGHDWGTDGPMTLLPEDFNSDPLRAVNIRGAGRSVTLRHGEKGWIVAERYGYPADYGKLKSLFIKLTETRVAQTLPADAKETPAYGLSDTDSATTMTFEGDDGRALRRLVFGRPYEKAGGAPGNPFGFSTGSRGRYMELDDGRAVLVSEGLDAVDGSVTDWLNREFFAIPAVRHAQLKEDEAVLWEIAYEVDDQVVKEGGPQKGIEPTLVGDIPDGKEIDATKVGAFTRVFSWLRFNDIASPEDSSDGTVRELGIIDGDDIRYTLRVFTLPDQAAGLQVEVEWAGAETRAAIAEESPEDKIRLDAEYAKTIAEKRAKARTLNDRLSPWTYVMDASFREKATPDRAYFLKDKAPSPPPAPPQDVPAVEYPTEPPATIKSPIEK